MIKEIIPQFLMVISLAAILLIVGKKISSAIAGANKDFTGLTEKTKDKSFYNAKKTRDGFLKFLEKSLRKTKIIFLKADARLLSLIGQLKSWREKRSQEKKVESSLDASIEEEGIQDSVSFKADPSPQKLFFGNGSSFKKKIKEKKISFLRRKEEVLPKKIDVAQTKRIMQERQERALIKRISLNPQNDEAYVELGRLYKDINNFRDALASFRQALKINKGNILAKKMLKEMEREKPI
jgi:tetratricopeptide (TPR) repeat protein